MEELLKGCITPRLWMDKTLASNKRKPFNEANIALEELIEYYELNKKGREHPRVFLRQFTGWFLIEVMDYTSLKTGKMLSIDHATALHCKNVTINAMETKDFKFLEATETIREELNNIKNTLDNAKFY